MPLKAADKSLVLYDRVSRVPGLHGQPRDLHDRHTLLWQFYDAAWEQEGGVCLRTAIGHPGNAGLVMFYPEPHASLIRKAMGDQVQAQAPEKKPA